MESQVFTIGDRTFTNDRTLAGGEVPEAVVGPFNAMKEGPLYTFGPYDNQEPIDIKLPGGKSMTTRPGVGIIIGAADSGKTYLADQIAGLNGYPKVTFEEPAPHALVGVRSLAAAMMKIPSLPQHGVVIDSIRTLFYTTQGATGRGGINMSIFATLTQWDIWAKSHSKVLFVIINPIQINEEILELIKEAGTGSVETYIVTPKKGLIQVASRTHDRMFKEIFFPNIAQKAQQSPTTIFVSAPLRTEASNELEGVVSLFSTLRTADKL